MTTPFQYQQNPNQQMTQPTLNATVPDNKTHQTMHPASPTYRNLGYYKKPQKNIPTWLDATTTQDNLGWVNCNSIATSISSSVAQKEISMSFTYTLDKANVIGYLSGYSTYQRQHQITHPPYLHCHWIDGCTDIEASLLEHENALIVDACTYAPLCNVWPQKQQCHYSVVTQWACMQTHLPEISGLGYYPTCWRAAAI